MTLRSDALSGESVLVAGGRGFVGAHVTGALIRAGARVHILGPAMAAERMTPLPGLAGETIGSVEDRSAVAEAFARSAATALVSCVGYGAGRMGLMRSGEEDRDAAMNVNVLGHGRLLEAAARHGARRVVWTSSTVVYGPAARYGPGRVDEAAPRAPETVYGLTKSLAEDVADFQARRSGLGVVGLRLPLVLGPGLWYQGAAAALAAFLTAAASGPARLTFHDAPMDLIHVADVADAILAGLTANGRPSPIYNLEGFTARASEIVADVRALRPGREATYEKATPPPLLFPLVSGARLRAETGFSPRHDRVAFVRAMLDDAASR